jgi:hypothetical protein
MTVTQRVTELKALQALRRRNGDGLALRVPPAGSESPEWVESYSFDWHKPAMKADLP